MTACELIGYIEEKIRDHKAMHVVMRDDYNQGAIDALVNLIDELQLDSCDERDRGQE